MNRGSYMRLYPMATRLSESGYNVTLICPHEFSDPSIESRLINDNFRLILLPRFKTETHYAGILLRAILIVLHLSRNRYDILHVSSPAFLDTWSVSMIGKLFNIPTVVDIDDLWGQTGNNDRSSFESAVEEFLIRSAIVAAKRVIVVSQFLKDRYNNLCHGEIDILWNGISEGDLFSISKRRARDTLIFELGLETNVKLLLSQVRKDQEETAIEAVEIVKSKGFDIVSTMPGAISNHSTDKLLANCKKVGSTFLLPRVERKRFLEMLIASDLVLFSMKNTEWERARFPIRLTEFLASGTPLVPVVFGESRRILEMTSYGPLLRELNTNSSAEALAQSIVYYLSNAEELDKIAEEARKFVITNLTWEQVISQLIGIYKDLKIERSSMS